MRESYHRDPPVGRIADFVKPVFVYDRKRPRGGTPGDLDGDAIDEQYRAYRERYGIAREAR